MSVQGDRATDRAAGRRAPDESGSAVVEFVTLGVLLLVPLAYLVMTLARVQAASFAVDSAARGAARAFTTAPDEATGRARVLAAVRLALRDQGFDDEPATAARLTCAASPCLTPQGRVSVEVTVDVVLPGVPSVVDRFAGTHVRVVSARTATVDAFRATAEEATAEEATAEEATASPAATR
jgi:hypothetical protein